MNRLKIGVRELTGFVQPHADSGWRGSKLEIDPSLFRHAKQGDLLMARKVMACCQGGGRTL